jgi:hypothetical protein
MCQDITETWFLFVSPKPGSAASRLPAWHIMTVMVMSMQQQQQQQQQQQE